MPLVKQTSDNHPNAIGYTLKDYLELIDWIAGDSVYRKGMHFERTLKIFQEEQHHGQ